MSVLYHLIYVSRSTGYADLALLLCNKNTASLTKDGAKIVRN